MTQFISEMEVGEPAILRSTHSEAFVDLHEEKLLGYMHGHGGIEPAEDPVVIDVQDLLDVSREVEKSMSWPETSQRVFEELQERGYPYRTCKRCGGDLGENGLCTDPTCPFDSHAQSCEKGWTGHIEKDPSLLNNELTCSC